ncbi:MAG: nucleotidyl transferase AbiEii/AbiGii toxin family protein [Alphaproteobacteria bacterium]
MIEKIANLSALERNAIFIEASSQYKINAEMIEKDFWVCWTLNRIFINENLSKILCFKGGTSLSKVFNLIERFSEDIDLILDWNTISEGKEIVKNSKNQQDKRNKELLSSSQEYIKAILQPLIQEACGDTCIVEIDINDPNTLQVKYPKSVSGSYLRPFIKLEIGALAAWLPNQNHSIKPYINNLNEKLIFEDIIVPTITAERTFWEKATILHKEHYRTSGNPDRYSRHYYDLYKMANSKIKQSSFQQKDLLTEVVEFKKTFYPSGWANYDKAKLGTLKLMPSALAVSYLEKDYAKMHEMIFGDYPSFDTIMSFLEALETEINNLEKEQ